MNKVLIIALLLLTSACSSVGLILKGAGDGLKESASRPRQVTQANCTTVGANTNCNMY